jgi:hypothetical protein
MAGKQFEKEEPMNEVRSNAIWREHLVKEQRHQKLYTHFLFNLYKERELHFNFAVAALKLVSIADGKPLCVLAPKPNVKIDEGQEDGKIQK